jgi:hypothetical protein
MLLINDKAKSITRTPTVNVDELSGSLILEIN